MLRSAVRFFSLAAASRPISRYCRKTEEQALSLIHSDRLADALPLIREHSNNLRVVSALFSYFIRNQHFSQANRYYLAIIKEAKLIEDASQAEGSLIILIESLVLANQESKARELFETFPSLRESAAACAAMLDYYATSFLFTKAEQWITSCSRQKGFTPTAQWFNCILRLYAMQKEQSKMLQVSKRMSELGIRRDIEFYNQHLLYHTNQLDQESILHDCEQVMNDLSSESLSLSAETFYLLLVKMLRFSNFDQIRATIRHLEESPSASLTQSHIFNLCKMFIDASYDEGVGLMMRYCDKKEASSPMRIRNLWLSFLLGKCEVASAIQLLGETVRLGIPLNAETFEILLKFYASHVEIETCNLLLFFMNGRFYSREQPLSQSHLSALMGVFYYVANERTNPILFKYLPARSDEGSQWRLVSVGSTNFLNLGTVKLLFESLFPMVPFRASVNIFNDLLIYTLRQNSLAEFSQIFRDLESSGVPPNPLTWLLRIKALIVTHDIEGACSTVDEMHRQKVPVPMICYALLLHYYCRLLDTQNAERLLEKFEYLYRFRVNYVFYSSLLYAYSRSLNFYRVIATFNRLEKQFLISDTETFNYVMEAYMKLGNSTEALRMYETMQQQSIPRNWFSYCLLFDFCIANDREYLKYAYERVIPDCMVSGNSVAAQSFDRLLFYHHCNSNVPQIQWLLFKMHDYQIRWNYSTIEFVAIVVRNLLQSASNVEDVFKLLYKLCTDFSPENAAIEEIFYSTRLHLSDPFVQHLDLLHELYRNGLVLIPPSTSILCSGYSMEPAPLHPGNIRFS